MESVITFDFWNTLYMIHSGSSYERTRVTNVSKVLQKFGFQFSHAELQDAFKYGWQKAAYCQRAFGYDIKPRGQLQCIQEKLQLQLDGAIADQVYQTYTRTLLDWPPQLNDGVRETLPLLAQHYDLAVICNTGISPGSVLRQLLAADGVDRFFRFMVFSDEVGWAKPNPLIFSYTLQHLGCTADKAVHIGDDPITDVIGAKRSGMTAVWLAPGQTWTVPEADYHVKNVAELLTLFD